MNIGVQKAGLPDLLLDAYFDSLFTRCDLMRSDTGGVFNFITCEKLVT